MLKGRTLYKYILLILILLCILFIFYNSSRDAESSKEYSMRIVRVVESITAVVYGDNPPNELTNFLKIRFEDVLRDSAHVIEFLVLGIPVMVYFYRFNGSIFKRISLSLPFCIFIAVIDEIIQIYSPGRAFEVYDLCLDFMGSLIGAMLVIIFYKLRKKSAE